MEGSNIIAYALMYLTTHEQVKDNPKKLLEAKGADMTIFVSNECAQGMKRHKMAEHFLLDAAGKVNQDSLRKERAVIDAAIRYQKATELNRGNPNMISSHHKDDPRIEEYFSAHSALIKAIRELAGESDPDSSD